MQVPLEMSFRGVNKTPDLEDLIHRQVAKLERVCDYMVGCRIAVERPHQHQDRGNPYRVRLDITVPPGKELVVKRLSTEGDLHDDLPSVVRDAFSAARRQLKELVERQRGHVKIHPAQQTNGIVVKLFPDEGYGIAKLPDTTEAYFHRNSVLNDDFDRLTVGTGVHCVLEDGEEGPQCSTVHLVDRPSPRTTEDRALRGGEDEPMGWS